MKNTVNALSILFVCLFACKSGEQKLFDVSAPNGQENDFLFLAESTNAVGISTDSLTYFLTADELISSEKLRFKNFGKIHAAEKFDVFVLLKNASNEGRHYIFIIRTFNKAFNLIDSYELASWKEAANRYCYGSIDKNLIIKRSCSNDKEVRQITDEGRIVVSSFH